MRFRLWLGGVAAGFIGLTVATYGLMGIAVVVAWVLIALAPPRFAGAAGLLVGLGLAAVVGWYQGRQRCLDMGPSCQFGDNTQLLVLAWVVVLGGLAVTALVARDARSVSRGG